MKIKDKYMSKDGHYIPVCLDCKRQVKRLIQHHIITKRLAKYLIDVQHWDRKRVAMLRADLQIFVCGKCEKKFHNGEFYIHNYQYNRGKNEN
jgi:DNA-directed RNA polymerase subunit RPC12/RpoP